MCALRRPESCLTVFSKRARKEDPEPYRHTRRQKAYFLWEIGANQENTDKFLPLVKAGSHS